MEKKECWVKRVLLGGVSAVAVMLLFILMVNLVLKSITWGGGSPNYGDIQLTTDGCAAYFGSVRAAVAVELLSVFALGAAIGVATLPFAEEGHTLAWQSLAHFTITGALAQLVGWSYQWVDIPRGWLLVLAAYVFLYVLVWVIRWAHWYAELVRMQRRMGLTGGRRERKGYEETSSPV